MTSPADDDVDIGDVNNSVVSSVTSTLLIPGIVLMTLNVFFALIGVSIGFTRLYVKALLLLFEVRLRHWHGGSGYI